jgi:parallel beta-helix repeat protein
VLVMDGVYTSDGSVNPLTITAVGRSDAWITFAAAPGQHPVIQIPRGSGATAGIYLPGAAYVIIDGFEVVGQNQSITAQEAAPNDGSQAVLNENCIYIDGMGFQDFHPPVPHDIVVRNSTVHDCSAGGIEVNVADAVTIEHNRVYNTSWWTVFGTSGIGLWHVTDVPGSTTKNGYKNFITANLVYGNRNNLAWKDGTPPGIYDGNAIIVDDARHTQKAGGIHDVRGVPYTGRTYIANNIVHDNGGRGIHIYSSDHVDVVNNTAYNDLLSSSEHITWGELDAFQCSDVNLLNNVAINRVGKDVNVADSGTRYDYNVWDAARVPVKGDHDMVGSANLSDPANANFAPLSNSPALRTGVSAMAPADDFFGNPRPAGAIDRGAVQVSK